MSLFDLAPGGEHTVTRAPTVETPLGLLAPTVTLGAWSSVLEEPETADALPNGGKVLHWRGGEVALLVASVHASLPPAMSVDGCCAMVWRVRTPRLTPIVFQVPPPQTTTALVRRPENGERLECTTWSDGRSKVSVGTQDTDCLASRARTEPIPAGGSPAGAWQDDRGLHVFFPALPADDICQIQFLAAWGPDGDIDDLSTWFAVDVDSDTLLRRLGVT